MPYALDALKARRLTDIVTALGKGASFRSILRESARENVMRDNETLRRYLDLLVLSGVLKMRTRDVGSVYPQQLYSIVSNSPRVSVGLACLRRHGLNWEIPEKELKVIPTDFEGLVRSRVIDSILTASLEDCLIQAFHDDSRRNTGGTSFVVAMISTRRLDLPYLIRRADEIHVGAALRLLFSRILDIVSSKEVKTTASVFLPVRAQFLKIARQYAQTGFWKLVEKQGVGELGLEIVRNLTDDEIIMAAGKQLGVTG
jgi:hypothetical protein